MKSAFSGLKIACLAVCLVLCGAGCSGHATTAASDDALPREGKRAQEANRRKPPQRRVKDRSYWEND